MIIGLFFVRYADAVPPPPVTGGDGTGGATIVSSPAVSTIAASSISSSTLTVHAAISATGGVDAAQSGFSYGTTADLSTVIATTTLGAETGAASFSQDISSLTADTAYYFRAYAINSAGAGYGSILSVTTLPWSSPDAPAAVSAATSSPNQATVSFAAPVNTGGSPVLYYFASSTPDNIAATSVTSPMIISGLTNGTSYSFTVYAVNEIGTSSPSSASNAVIPIAAVATSTIATSEASSVSTSSMTLNGAITDTGGADATQSGFTYGTVADLGTAFITSTLGAETGTASFLEDLAGLIPNTIYYFRAYAVNSAGTSTGAILSTTTLSSIAPLITPLLPLPIVSSGDNMSGNGGFAYVPPVNPTSAVTPRLPDTGPLLAIKSPVTGPPKKSAPPATIGASSGNSPLFDVIAEPINPRQQSPALFIVCMIALEAAIIVLVVFIFRRVRTYMRRRYNKNNHQHEIVQ